MTIEYLVKYLKKKNPTIFCCVIGALQYLTNTRLDIAFAFNMLSQYLNSLTIEHWQLGKKQRLLRYLKG